MPEEKKQVPLDEVMDEHNFTLLQYEVVKTRESLSDGRSFSYKEVRFEYNGKFYYVMGRHFPIEEVMKNGKSSCKICNGKGYYFSQISKKLYPDPSNFLIQEDALPKDLTPIEQEKWKKDEENKRTWRVLNICLCAVKATHLKHNNVMSNPHHNIWMTLDYEVKDS